MLVLPTDDSIGTRATVRDSRRGTTPTAPPRRCFRGSIRGRSGTGSGLRGIPYRRRVHHQRDDDTDHRGAFPGCSHPLTNDVVRSLGRRSRSHAQHGGSPPLFDIFNVHKDRLHSGQDSGGQRERGESSCGGLRSRPRSPPSASSSTLQGHVDQRGLPGGD